MDKKIDMIGISSILLVAMVATVVVGTGEIGGHWSVFGGSNHKSGGIGGHSSIGVGRHGEIDGHSSVGFNANDDINDHSSANGGNNGETDGHSSIGGGTYGKTGGHSSIGGGSNGQTEGHSSAGGGYNGKNGGHWSIGDGITGKTGGHWSIGRGSTGNTGGHSSVGGGSTGQSGGHSSAGGGSSGNIGGHSSVGGGSSGNMDGHSSVGGGSTGKTGGHSSVGGGSSGNTGGHSSVGGGCTGKTGGHSSAGGGSTGNTAGHWSVGGGSAGKTGGHFSIGGGSSGNIGGHSSVGGESSGNTDGHSSVGGGSSGKTGGHSSVGGGSSGNIGGHSSVGSGSSGNTGGHSSVGGENSGKTGGHSSVGGGSSGDTGGHSSVGGGSSGNTGGHSSVGGGSSGKTGGHSSVGGGSSGNTGGHSSVGDGSSGNTGGHSSVGGGSSGKTGGHSSVGGGSSGNTGGHSSVGDGNTGKTGGHSSVGGSSNGKVGGHSSVDGDSTGKTGGHSSVGGGGNTGKTGSDSSVGGGINDKSGGHSSVGGGSSGNIGGHWSIGGGGYGELGGHSSTGGRHNDKSGSQSSVGFGHNRKSGPKSGGWDVHWKVGHGHSGKIGSHSSGLLGFSGASWVVQQICQPTDFKEACVQTLSAACGSATDPRELIKIAFSLTIKHITDAMNNCPFLKKNEKDKRICDAIDNCHELLDSSIGDLQRSLERMGNFDITKKEEYMNDLKTWLSGAITYQQTCLDGFENTTGNTGNEMKKLLAFSGELTSNGLAMVTELSKIFSAFKFSGSFNFETSTQSRGLSSDLPGWNSDGQKKLMAATTATVKPNVVVAKDGSGKYKTIGEALKEVPKKSNSTFVIYIKAGVYNEYISINKSMRGVFLLGDGPTKTKITGSKSYMSGYNTYKTPTVAAEGDFFMAKDIGIENTAGPENHQAVALRVSSDRSVIYNCKIDGYQDTLYAHAHRQFYRDCTITGTIDFIFGDAAAVFQNCRIFIRKPMANQNCMVTAQGRKDKRGATGLVLQNCTVTGSPDYMATQAGAKFKSFLGRPWKNFSRTIVMNSEINSVIDPTGWAPWSGSVNLDTCWYAEFGNRGPGASKEKRVSWGGIQKTVMKDAVESFTPARFIDGDSWIPATGVPYASGMVAA